MFLIFQRLTTFILNLEKHPSCEMKVKKNRGKEPGSSHFTISISNYFPVYLIILFREPTSYGDYN